MFVGLYACLIAMPIGGAVRLLTMFFARGREKAWRWIAYVVPTIGIVVTLIRWQDIEADAFFASVMIAIIAFWSLTGSAMGAAIATRLVQGKPSARKDDQ